MQQAVSREIPWQIAELGWMVSLGFNGGRKGIEKAGGGGYGRLSRALGAASVGTDTVSQVRVGSTNAGDAAR